MENSKTEETKTDDFSTVASSTLGKAEKEQILENKKRSKQIDQNKRKTMLLNLASEAENESSDRPIETMDFKSIDAEKQKITEIEEKNDENATEKEDNLALKSFKQKTIGKKTFIKSNDKRKSLMLLATNATGGQDGEKKEKDGIFPNVSKEAFSKSEETEGSKDEETKGEKKEFETGFYESKGETTESNNNGKKEIEIDRHEKRILDSWVEPKKVSNDFDFRFYEEKESNDFGSVQTNDFTFESDERCDVDIAELLKNIVILQRSMKENQDDMNRKMQKNMSIHYEEIKKSSNRSSEDKNDLKIVFEAILNLASELKSEKEKISSVKEKCKRKCAKFLEEDRFDFNNFEECVFLKFEEYELKLKEEKDRNLILKEKMSVMQWKETQIEENFKKTLEKQTEVLIDLKNHIQDFVEKNKIETETMKNYYEKTLENERRENEELKKQITVGRTKFDAIKKQMDREIKYKNATQIRETTKQLKLIATNGSKPAKVAVDCFDFLDDAKTK